jgi:hypothetical protein
MKTPFRTTEELAKEKKRKDQIPDYLTGNGWKEIKSITTTDLKVVYGMARVGKYFQPIRVEVMDDGSVLTLALPENMKEIALQRCDSEERTADHIVLFTGLHGFIHNARYMDTVDRCPFLFVNVRLPCFYSEA